MDGLRDPAGSTPAPRRPVRTLVAFRRELRKATRKLEDLACQIADLAADFELCYEAHLLAGSTEEPDLSGLTPAVRKALARVACPFSRFQLDWHEGGGASATLGDHAPVKLSAKLAHLLDVIAEGKAAAEDGIVPWKSLEAVARALGERFPADPLLDTHGVTNLIHRLRRDLWHQGVNPYLVETHRARGVRLAYRPGASS